MRRIIGLGIVLVTIVFTGIFTYYPQILPIHASENIMPYEKSFEGILEVNIEVDEATWSNMLENATSETYVPANITINDTTVYGVGIRPKGNSSLTGVANSDSDRYSFKVDFDQYVSDQTYLGLDKLVLNNIYSDNTYFKEYISMDLMNEMGVTTPLYTFANIYVNGESWGTYFALEAYEESFLSRVYGSTSGNLYNVKNAQGMGGQSSGGGSLVYTGSTESDYPDIFENAVFSTSSKQVKRMVSFIESINANDDVETHVDMDQVIRYFAVHNFLVNMDSYTSNMAQNYYLYENGGVVTILPWDYNLAFGGFQATDSTQVANLPIDNPLSQTTLDQRPLLNIILSDESYTQQYHDVMQDLLDTCINSGLLESKIDAIYEIIEDDIANDPTRFSAADQYDEALSELKSLIALRAESVSLQLDGVIDSQTENQSNAVDASAIDLSVIGAQTSAMGAQRNQQFNDEEVDLDGALEIPQGERPQGEMPQGEMPQGEMPQGEMPQGDRPQADTPQTEGTNPPGSDADSNASEAPDGNSQFPNSSMPDGGNQNGQGPIGTLTQQTGTDWSLYIYVGSSVLLLCVGMIVVKRQKKSI